MGRDVEKGLRTMATQALCIVGITSYVDEGMIQERRYLYTSLSM